jgi:hypothetical protein
MAVFTSLAVYDGTRALGEIEDYGHGDVRAWVGVGDERKAIGTYPDRKAAMRGISEAVQKKGTAEALAKLAEPVGFVSGLPSHFLDGDRQRR